MEKQLDDCIYKIQKEIAIIIPKILMEKQILFEEHRVIFAPWNDDLIDELISFPNAEHDDMVDAMLFTLTETRNKFFITAI